MARSQGSPLAAAMRATRRRAPALPGQDQRAEEHVGLSRRTQGVEVRGGVACVQRRLALEELRVRRRQRPSTREVVLLRPRDDFRERVPPRACVEPLRQRSQLPHPRGGAGLRTAW